jgi:hypothetical protein
VRYGARVARRHSKSGCPAAIKTKALSRGHRKVAPSSIEYPDAGTAQSGYQFPFHRNGCCAVARNGASTMRCGRHEPMGDLTANEIAAFVTLALLLALVLVLLLR